MASRRCAAAVLVLGASVAMCSAAAGAVLPVPNCDYRHCTQCLPNAKPAAAPLQMVGADGNVYQVPLRVSVAYSGWDTVAVYGRIIKILVSEVLGFQVAFVDCLDEVSCYLATCNCAGWKNYQCNVVGDGIANLDGKLFGDTLADIMFTTEVYRETVMDPSNFAGSEMDFDSRTGIAVGPSGFTSVTGAYIFDAVVKRAWEGDRLDLLWLGHYRSPKAVKYLNTPDRLILEGVVPQVSGCSSTVGFVQAGMSAHEELGWACQESWWLTPACVALGDHWKSSCVSMLDDDWGSVKPEVYNALVKSGVPIAKVMVGYDPWVQLLRSGRFNVTFTYWNTDGSFMFQRPRRIALLPELEAPAVVNGKAAWSPALNADVRLKGLLQNSYISNAHLASILTAIGDGLGRGYNTSGPFYDKVACDWVRANRDTWAVWFPSASSCAQGQIFDQTAGVCQPCEQGFRYARSRNGTFYCKPCAPGTYAASKGSLQCTACPPGTFQSELGMYDCTKCPAGHHRMLPGGTVCEACEPGRAMVGTGASACMDCGVGTFSAANATACTMCAVSTYADSIGATACTPCQEPGTTQGRGAASSAECICPEGTYMRAQGNATAAAGSSLSCLPCPEKMACALASSEDSLASVAAGNGPLRDSTGAIIPYPVVLKGFWAPRDAPLSVFRCFSAGHCPGGDPGACGPGLEDQACVHCSAGTYWDGGECRPCSRPEKSQLVFPGVAVLVAVVLVLIMYVFFRDPYEKWNSWQNGFGVLVFLCWNHYQVLSLVSSSTVDFPALIKAIFGIWSFSQDALSVFRPGCAGFTSFRESLVFQTVLPAGLMAVTVFLFCGSHCIDLLLRRRLCGMDFSRTWNVVFSLIFTFFNGIAGLSMSLFKCTLNPNGKYTLARDLSVDCYEGTWNTLVLVAVAAILVYCVGCGMLFLWAVVVAVKDQRFCEPDFQMRWKFLFIKFRPDVHWWALVILARGVSINLAFVAVKRGLGQLYWVMMGETVYLSLTIYFMPWRQRSANALAVCTSISIIYACALLAIYTDRDPDLLLAVSQMCTVISYSPLFVAVLLTTYIVGTRFKLLPGSALTRLDYDKLHEVMTYITYVDKDALMREFHASGEWDRFYVMKTCEVVRSEFMGIPSYSSRTISRTREEMSAMAHVREQRKKSLRLDIDMGIQSV